MFTGIIEEKQPILNITAKHGKIELRVKASVVLQDLKIGDSIASNGICLTVNHFDSFSFVAEIMNETWQKSTAKFWKKSTVLNLERALQYGSRLDGHLVQGHIDCIGVVQKMLKIKDTYYYKISYPSENRNLLIPQGSIAVNGVSLTIAELSDSVFSIALISHSKKETNFESLKTGDYVNLEFDALGKYIANYAKKANIADLLKKYNY